VIVTTQRPDAKVVPGQIKANMPATVAFRVRANVNSEILVGESNYAAAALPPDMKGRAIWQWDRETEFQAVYLAKEEAETLKTASSWLRAN
jgi:DNA segregation ATPase FtsK/SpoIIIE, S-DNA-T family